MSSQQQYDVQRSVVVDLYLLTPILLLTESLLNYHDRKVVIDFFDYAIKNKVKFGRTGFLSWLRDKSDFVHKDKLEKILKTTPLGNPAWFLFAKNGDTTLSLINDLKSYILNASIDQKSLSYIVKCFIQQNPKYGNASAYAKAMDMSENDVVKMWSSDWTTLKNGDITFIEKTNKWSSQNILGDLTLTLMKVQREATPISNREIIERNKRLNTFEELKEPEFPIYRPLPFYYSIAFQYLISSSLHVNTDVWDEMISLYHQKTFTNFLPFTPILIQPFLKECGGDTAIPTINDLATIMGCFRGETSTFVGETVREDKVIRWDTLAMTLGKLCVKTGKLPPVILTDESDVKAISHLTNGLSCTSKIACPTERLSEVVPIGKDVGWSLASDTILNSKDRWDTDLDIIISTLITDKITLKAFPKERDSSLIFKNYQSLTILGWWVNRISKQGLTGQQRGTKVREHSSHKKDDRATVSNSAHHHESPTDTFSAEQHETSTSPMLLSMCGSPSALGSKALVLPKSDDKARATFSSEETISLGRRCSNDNTCSHSIMQNMIDCREACSPWRIIDEPRSANKSVSSIVYKTLNYMLDSQDSPKNGELGSCACVDKSNSECCKISGRSTSDQTTPKRQIVISQNHKEGHREQDNRDTVPRNPTCQQRNPRPIHDIVLNDTPKKCAKTDGIYRYFYAESPKEDRRKKATILRLRESRLKMLRAEYDNSEFRLKIKAMNDNALIARIRHLMKSVKETELNTDIPQVEKAQCIGELEELLAELMFRHLGLTCPRLYGLKTVNQIADENKADESLDDKDDEDYEPDRHYHFRYFLGDEEATAMESWRYAIVDDKPPAVTKAARNVWCAMTLIYLSRHIKKEGKDLTLSNLWSYDDFEKFPIDDLDKAKIKQIIPYLYWVYVLEEQDFFRKQKPIMETELFLPTARISHFHELEKNISELMASKHYRIKIRAVTHTIAKKPIINKSSKSVTYVPDLLEDVRISSLSLCSLSEWRPESILHNIENFFGVNYSSDLHPEKTGLIRRYVSEAVSTLAKRLSSKNLASFLTYISNRAANTTFSVDETFEIFEKKKEELLTWSSNFTKEFDSKWEILGDEWVSFSEVEIEEDILKELKPQQTSKNLKRKKSSKRKRNISLIS